MTNIVVTLKVMPESPDTNLEKLRKEVEKKISKFGNIGRVQVEDVAFGLKALIFIFLMDEKKGSTEPIEKAVSAVDGVSSAEVTDVRRAIG